LPAGERRIVWLAALLHDVAKPLVTKTDGDRITSKGHSSAGAIVARELLWRAGAPFTEREAVCGLVAHHQVPFFLVDRPDAEGRAARLSQDVRCDWLALVAEADARGREAVDRQRIVDATELFRALCADLGCLSAPWPFGSAHAAFLCARDPARSVHAPPPPDPAFTVVLTSGLPACGKDTWLATHAPDLPVVSLDALRAELDVDPEDPQGTVVQTARERAREHLRAGRPFAWNATNLSRRRRSPLIDLCADYGAAVRIVYLETNPKEQRRRNRAREHPVPERVVTAMLRQWEVPTRSEGHAVEAVITG
jgi:predicted kinase